MEQQSIGALFPNLKTITHIQNDNIGTDMGLYWTRLFIASSNWPGSSRQIGLPVQCNSFLLSLQITTNLVA